MGKTWAAAFALLLGACGDNGSGSGLDFSAFDFSGFDFAEFDLSSPDLGAPPDLTPELDGSVPCASAPMLRGMWRAEGNTNDSTGNYNGVAQGGLAYAAGKIGQAFQGNGTDAIVKIDDNEALWPTGDFSVLAWVKVTSGSYQTILHKSDCWGTCPATARSQFLLYMEDSGLAYFRFQSGASGNASHEISAATNIGDGNWHLVVGVRDVVNGQQLIYVDDHAADTSAISGEALTALQNGDAESDPMVIGAYEAGGATTLNQFDSGLIDEVAVLHHALTAAEVLAIFNSPGGICP